jgi:hypothetical protein
MPGNIKRKSVDVKEANTASVPSAAHCRIVSGGIVRV